MGRTTLIRPRARHRWSMAFDVAIILLSFYRIFNLRFAGSLSEWMSWSGDFSTFAAIAVAVHLVINWFTGVYSIIGRYMSLAQAMRLVEAGVLAFGALFLLVLAWPLLAGSSSSLMPRWVVLGGGLLTVLLMLMARFSKRV